MSEDILSRIDDILEITDDEGQISTGKKKKLKFIVPSKDTKSESKKHPF